MTDGTLFIVFLLVFPDKQKRRSIYLFIRGLFRAGIKTNAATHTYREQGSGYQWWGGRREGNKASIF